MIDLEKAKNEFIKYVNNYNVKEENINRKVYHSLRVMNISRNIAEEIKLPEEDKKLAELIGLLHDIARFELFTKYLTYDDAESIDHGCLGVEILLESDFIRKFVEDDKYDNLIIKSIYNHNKFEIEKGLTEKENLFCEIIRDADKIDILYETVEVFFTNDKEEINMQLISDDVYDSILNLKLIERRKNLIRNKLEKLISHIAFVFDMNFDESLNIIKENNYINKILDRFDFKNIETKEKMEQIRLIAENYFEKRLK